MAIFIIFIGVLGARVASVAYSGGQLSRDCRMLSKWQVYLVILLDFSVHEGWAERVSKITERVPYDAAVSFKDSLALDVQTKRGRPTLLSRSTPL